MYCPECDLQVETEFSIVREQEEAERRKRYLNDVEIRGPYDIDDVGQVELGGPKVDSRKPKVCMRVDACANCSSYLDARTFVQV